MTTHSADISPTGGQTAEFWAPRRALTLDAARRHSARIYRARQGLIGFACILLAILAYYFISAPKTVLPTDNPDETVKMVNPIYKGRTADLLPYRITADEAIRFIQNPDEVHLTKPILNFLRTKDAKESVILAATGLYDSKNQVLELRQDVNLSTDDGYTCATSHGRIFVKGKHIEGDEPISCAGDFGLVSGKAFEINDGYKEFVFKNGITARLNPKKANHALRGTSAPTTTPKSSAKLNVSFSGNEPIDVIAQRAVYIGAKILLTGNVDVKQIEARILADKMNIYREQSSASADGAVKYGNVKRIVATGNFKYSNPENSVLGDKGVYEHQKNIITVTGNVVFTQQSGNKITGCALVYDLTTNRAKFQGGCVGKSKDDDGRVVIKIGQ